MIASLSKRRELLTQRHSSLLQKTSTSSTENHHFGVFTVQSAKADFPTAEFRYVFAKRGNQLDLTSSNKSASPHSNVDSALFLSSRLSYPLTLSTLAQLAS